MGKATQISTGLIAQSSEELQPAGGNAQKSLIGKRKVASTTFITYDGSAAMGQAERNQIAEEVATLKERVNNLLNSFNEHKRETNNNMKDLSEAVSSLHSSMESLKNDFKWAVRIAAGIGAVLGVVGNFVVYKILPFFALFLKP